ncbi:TPA: hypothetical protein L6A99_11795 [Pseudomonas aeruginosa]|nr:hypothetical protein [Pseudomonas aeruginosa]
MLPEILPTHQSHSTEQHTGFTHLVLDTYRRSVIGSWLTGRLSLDFKAIADFRYDNGEAIRDVCRQFIVLCRHPELGSGVGTSTFSHSLDRKHPCEESIAQRIYDAYLQSDSKNGER